MTLVIIAILTWTVAVLVLSVVVRMVGCEDAEEGCVTCCACWHRDVPYAMILRRHLVCFFGKVERVT